MSWRKAKCKQCKSSDQPVSRRGLCHDCAMYNCREAARQLRDRKGNIYENYKKGMIKYLDLK